MTEAEWLACKYPTPLLDFALGQRRWRKLRLFAVASCRRMGDRIRDEAYEKALRAAEEYADDPARRSKLTRAWNRAEAVVPPGPRRSWVDWAVTAAVQPAPFLPGYVAEAAMRAVADVPGKSKSTISRLQRIEAGAQALLLRGFFGNPFRPVALDPGWRTSTVVALAEGIYEDRVFDRLPFLADALQDAGCENEEVLTHCRSDGPHARGCWVVDLLLGKS